MDHAVATSLPDRSTEVAGAAHLLDAPSAVPVASAGARSSVTAATGQQSGGRAAAPWKGWRCQAPLVKRARRATVRLCCARPSAVAEGRAAEAKGGWGWVGGPLVLAVAAVSVGAAGDECGGACPGPVRCIFLGACLVSLRVRSRWPRWRGGRSTVGLSTR